MKKRSSKPSARRKPLDRVVRAHREWPVQVFADLSTVHVREVDGRLFSRSSRVLAELPDGSGHLLHIADWSREDILMEGFSSDFADLIKLLQMDGFTHLRLDRDGGRVDFLRTYEW